MKLFRTQSWWNTIVPQVLGWIYFAVTSNLIREGQHGDVVPFSPNGELDYLIHSFYFLVALVCIAAFGYLFNDLCDVETDALAGKVNIIGRLAMPVQIMLVCIPVVVASFAWYKMNQCWAINGSNMKCANVFFVAQIISLVIYSAKPLRLKDRAEWGVVVDAFYGHLNPVLITICVFGFQGWWETGDTWKYLFWGTLVWVCSIKGIRNILLHQIEDRKKDSSSQINTMVIKYGPWRIINFINNFLFPAEIFFLVCLTIVICIHVPPMFIPLMLFAVVSYLKLSGWKVGYADRRLLEFKFTYFMNDYYEGWFPVFTLIILSVYRHEFVFLLILHLLLFPRFILNLVKDLKKIKENFKTEEDY